MNATPLAAKSSLEEIRSRFDHDVERFSRLETGQQATIDAPLVLELVARNAARHLRPGAAVLDLGCGAGNFTLRLLAEARGLECHLCDLSRPMLERAEERIRQGGAASVRTFQSDLRDLPFAEASFDIILAGAVLHHLRDEADWERVFGMLHRWLRPGGRLYVADLVTCEIPDVQALMWDRYAAYLEGLGGPSYREKVCSYIDREDSPRSLQYQLELLRRTGFPAYDVLHRHSVFACYVAARSAPPA